MRALLPTLLALLALAGCTTQSPTTSQNSQPAPRPTVGGPPPPPPVPAHYENARDAYPLPATLAPAAFTEPYIQAAYKVAQQIPEVLAQQPCYCYCDRGHGHKGLLDCFRDNHGAHCGVCLKEAILAKKLHDEKFTPSEIRTAIERGDWKTIELGNE